jgi:hypothetical protein
MGIAYPLVLRWRMSRCAKCDNGHCGTDHEGAAFGVAAIWPITAAVMVGLSVSALVERRIADHTPGLSRADKKLARLQRTIAELERETGLVQSTEGEEQ